MSVGDNLWVTLLPTFGTRNPKGLTILRGGGFKNTPLESKFCYSNNQSIWGLGFVHSFFGTSLLVKKIQVWWFVMNCFRAWRIHHHLSHNYPQFVMNCFFRAWRIHYHLSRNYPQFVMNCFFRAWRIHYHLSRNYPQFVMNRFRAWRIHYHLSRIYQQFVMNCFRTWRIHHHHHLSCN
jgi:hypothetical protein